MKAYEIKVTIKNSKPPIWRKIIIPADINFMQLHNIIQTAFEWLNYHLYEFTFKDFPERITNDTEACEEYKYYSSKEGKRKMKDFWGYMPTPQKSLYAKDIPIKEYFNKSKKFNYIYDFGDWWEHSVEILNYYEDYTESCPAVIKFKQVSPPDDCGGIDGYYEFLEQYNDESNANHESIVEWAEQQGYSDNYDLEYINSEMEDVLDFDPDDWEDLL